MVNDYRWVLGLIDQCYAAATEDNGWPELLGEVRKFLDCHGATLFFTDRELKPIDEFFSDSVSPEAIASYQDHFHTIDIRMQRAIPASLNKVVTDRDLVDEETVRKHEFYQDFLRLAGHRFVASAMIDLEDGAFAFCSMHRGLKQEHVQSDDLDKMRLILPHIKRSLQLRRRFRPVATVGASALDILDRFHQAVFFINQDGRIAWQNMWASRLLEQRDGLMTNDGELRLLSPSAHAELQGLVASAIQVRSRPKGRPGGMMPIARPSLKRAYQVLVAPLRRRPESASEHGLLHEHAGAVIFIVDPEEEVAPSAEVLATLYNLTPAEARLATALAAGNTLKAYAERYRLSIHYVRWLLKQVEGKTDTRRIGDLTRLLVRQSGLFIDMMQNKKEKKK
jgi:DNA-binding CsgD family transcriptional regulator